MANIPDAERIRLWGTTDILCPASDCLWWKVRAEVATHVTETWFLEVGTNDVHTYWKKFVEDRGIPQDTVQMRSLFWGGVRMSLMKSHNTYGRIHDIIKRVMIPEEVPKRRYGDGWFKPWEENSNAR
jgi:hypothetical protein